MYLWQQDNFITDSGEECADGRNGIAGYNPSVNIQKTIRV